MATYKVIQDIEAEDKILGPLTLRQFIYAGVAIGFLYLCYLVATKGLGFMVILFLPVALVFGFFAFPWGRDQPTELWALAKIRFFLKPRRKIWDQSGVKELVTITAPKKEFEAFSNNLSQTEVKSRLRALADTIDSRGWVVKNAAVGITPLVGMQQGASDRLLDASVFSQPQPVVTTTDVKAADDILDEKNNPRAQQVDSMITASAKAHRQKLMDEMSQSNPAPTPPAQQAPANNYWFLNQPSAPTNAPQNSVTFNTQVVEPGTIASDNTATPAAPTVDEAALVQQLEAQKQKSPTASYYGHLHMIQPLSEQKKQIAKTALQNPLPAIDQPRPQSVQNAVPTPPPPVTPTKQAAILQLASNDDLNVATIAREAKRAEPDEVVIKLH